ncbi:Sialidase A precursor [Paraliobacillus sp. PM-2]|uniref:sialidase family protein n=1 Tax=Paraliobacillus sp. PM-2 TaxID=1462524 RepID=UPI00061CBF63|nr:sialidase family protein [Paraliobacillus sp. PM-2]CQR47170.1 Sialidase A precursor [Paraliobacillus sp. PM-2]
METKLKNGITDPIDLFYPRLAGSMAYRIPSMITTKTGAIIASIDARIVDSRDNPNKIETAIRRSLDNGENWSSIQKLVAYPGEGLDGAAAIDTALLQDEETGTIWLTVCHTPGGVGLWNSDTGIGFDNKGRRVLYDVDHNEYYLDEKGKVYDSLEMETSYLVDSKGNVFVNGVQKGNIFLKQGVDMNESLLEARTSFLQIIRSDDDGLTWSDPIDLNTQVKEPWMAFIGAGPGRGLQLKEGKHKGRLLFPIYYSNKHRKMSCALIYSDDHGVTWKRSESPNDGRAFNGVTLDAETLSEKNSDLTESQIVEMPNGDIHVYMRNHSGKQRIALAVSKDGGNTWSDVSYHDELIDPTCQSSILKYPDQEDGKTRLLFSNPADEQYRTKGTVRLSEDGGKTWPYAKQIEPTGFIYSCLTVFSNGEVGLLYEKSSHDDDSIIIKFIAFNLEWLKS